MIHVNMTPQMLLDALKHAAADDAKAAWMLRLIRTLH